MSASCLLKLESGDLVSQVDGDLIEVVVTLNIGAKPPVVEEGDFDHQGREGGGLRPQELDKPVGEDVWVGLDRDNGYCE